MKHLGTILPDMAKLAKADAFADAQKVAREKAASGMLSGLPCSFINGENRYWLSAKVYAVVGRRGVLWFEIRKDGEHSIPSPFIA